MSELMKFLALAAVLGCCLPSTVTANLGEWGEVERCPNGQVAVGFAMKIPKEDGDDAAVNSISLQCSGGSWIYSAQAPSGEWGRNSICPGGSVLISCSFRVDEDSTSITSMNCYCNLLGQMIGDGLNKGNWQNLFPPICKNGVTGLQTRVRGKTEKDSAAITDVKYVCG